MGPVKSANFILEDVINLTPLPDKIFDLSDEERIKWLQNEFKKQPQSVEGYRLNRQLFYEFYWLEKNQVAKDICEKTQPLRDDYYYRENCIEVSFPKYADYLPRMLELIHEAKSYEHESDAASLLANLAWRQSQYGDIAGTYQNYEAALSIAPADDILLINTIMMDTATNYIVHGDDAYINKGIELLKKTREQSQRALAKETDVEMRAILQDNIELTHFNTGIAHMLHLYDYTKALESFDKLNKQQSVYAVSALSFSSLAAAKLSKLKKAKSYISLLAGRKDSQKVVENYLNCYRQLAIRHWDKAQNLKSCLNVDSNTTIEVQLDVYRRLSEINDPEINLAGLQKLKQLFIEKIEPQLKNRGSIAASNTELRRLQRESELKSVVLKQQEQLQLEKEIAADNRQRFFIALVAVMISIILLIISQLRQKKRLAEQYQQMSVRDSLTKLGNRRYLEQQMNREFAYLHRELRTNKQAALGIYIFDIDHFKKINDSYGHQAGDEVLQELSKRITQATRDTDLLVRWGGEEFVFIARLDTKERTYQLADRILSTINSQPFEVSQHDPIAVTCTLGVVKFPFIDTGNLNLWSRLINLADAALYYGKMKQRNCWVALNNENINAKEQLDELLKRPLEEAVEQGLISIKTSIK
jgi:diguanylate cyclase (GGDEF)-like protein